MFSWIPPDHFCSFWRIFAEKSFSGINNKKLLLIDH